MKAHVRDKILEVLETRDSPTPASIISAWIWVKYKDQVSALSVGKYCRELALDGHILRSRKGPGFIYLYEKVGGGGAGG